MKADRSIAAICLAMLMAVATSTQAQELHFLSNRVNQALDANREAARDWFAAIATQPREIRSAALELSQYPELVVRLRYVDGPTAVDKLSTGQPESVRAAINALAMHPDIVVKMSEQLVATTLAGQVYRSEPAVVSALIEQMNQAAVERSEGAVKGWKARMLRDATAQQQWQDVRMASRAPGMPATASVADLPTPTEINRALTNGDIYAELAAELIDQWEAERNPDEFRMALDMWYARNHEVLPDSFTLDIPQLVLLVREHTRFEKEFAKFGATPGTINRRTMLETRAAEFPALIKVRDQKALARLRAKPIRVAGAPWSGSSGGSSSGSSTSGSSSRSSGTGSSGRTSRSRSSSDSSGGMFASGGSRSGGRGRSSRSSSRNSSNSGNSGFGASSGSGGFGNSGGGFGGGNSGGFGNSGGGFGGGGGGFGGGGGGFGGGSGGSSFGGGSNFGGSSGSSAFGQTGSRFGGSSNR